ncbi:PREDICTED: cysteine proteinase inhibitor 4-like [Tarenaya hassleriana]|uniref:cysteine proteinase inhibitor 4-like n=1 Tax=Tarenaya hassleriana TaxID=28532 RepID=UPI00053CA553|nr:PREDICTED: cysteine proteinase inhibitor 4-like [Tarenaya hassleriana]
MELTRSMIVLCLIVLPLVAGGSLLGGWQPIKDVNDPKVVEIAKYAVSEHNKQSKSDLTYERVDEGQTQVVSGIRYRLVVQAKNGAAGKSKFYLATVVDGATGKRVLKSFKYFLG